MAERIAVIVLNWNGVSDTLECLASVYRSDDEDFYCIVADNGSTDNSLTIIPQTYPQTRILSNGENLGFAEGNNRAIRLAMDEGAKYIFLLNNDAIIAPQTLSQLRRAAEEHPNAAALGPKVYYYDKPTTVWSGAIVWHSNIGLSYTPDYNVEEPNSCQDTHPTEVIIGCALFARCSHLRQVGLMDARFFLTWEETDWCFRMRKQGFDCIYVPAAKAWHKVCSSFIGGSGGLMRRYFEYRNRLLFLERHLPLSLRLRLAKKVIWPELKRCMSQFFCPQKGPIARATLAGFRDYCLRRFGKGPF